MRNTAGIALFLGIPEVEVMMALGMQFVPSTQVEARDYYRLLSNDTSTTRQNKAVIMRLWRKFTREAVLSANTVDEAKSAFFRAPDVDSEKVAALKKWLSLEQSRDGLREIVRNTNNTGRLEGVRRSAIKKLAEIHF